jgi:hypothetical protein
MTDEEAAAVAALTAANVALRTMLVALASRAPWSGPNNADTLRYAFGRMRQEAFAVLGWPNPVKVEEMR